MIPKYRPAFGFGLWLGATVLDLALIEPGSEASGFLSLLGFLLALAWALGRSAIRAGEIVDDVEGGDRS